MPGSSAISFTNLHAHTQPVKLAACKWLGRSCHFFLPGFFFVLPGEESSNSARIRSKSSDSLRLEVPDNLVQAPHRSPFPSSFSSRGLHLKSRWLLQQKVAVLSLAWKVAQKVPVARGESFAKLQILPSSSLDGMSCAGDHVGTSKPFTTSRCQSVTAPFSLFGRLHLTSFMSQGNLQGHVQTVWLSCSQTVGLGPGE